MRNPAFSPPFVLSQQSVHSSHTHSELPQRFTLHRHRCVALNGQRPIRRTATQRRHFLNLSNGLEASAAVASLVGLEEVRVTRLQSSHCEAQAYDAVLRSLGPELLFSLAVGYDCYLYDFGSRDAARGVPRALFLGLQFVKWALAYLWFGEQRDVVLVRGKNVAEFWRESVMPYRIEKTTKKMLRYYGAFAEELDVREIRLFGVYGRTTRIDGCMDAYARMVKEVWKGEAVKDGNRGDRRGYEEWLIEQGLAVYDAESSAEELVRRQIWMREGSERSN